MRAPVALLLVLSACSFEPRGTASVIDGGDDGGGGDDAAVIDAAVIDAAVIDAAMIDAAVIDAAVIDAAMIDAAVIDARPIDAPPPIDARPIDAPPACPGYVAVSGAPTTSRYRRVRTYTRWPAAEADCESDGGHLMIPETDAEATAVVNFVGPESSSAFIWVGASDVDDNGVWTTVLGDTISPNWAPGQPSDTSGEDYLLVTRTPRYYDWGGTQYYACECDGNLVP